MSTGSLLGPAGLTTFRQWQLHKTNVLFRSAPFGDFTQCRMAVYCRHFGATYLSHSSAKPSKTLEFGTYRLPRIVGKELALCAA